MGGFIPTCVCVQGAAGALRCLHSTQCSVLAPLPKSTYQGLKPSRQGGGSKASVVLICLMNVN